mgnify:CR=1 FL=1
MVHNLGHSFGRGFLFRRLDFSLESGQILGITGPNGAGKSTLLRILAGLLHPREGSCTYDHQGRPLEGDQLRSRLGWLSPHSNLYAHLTARENLLFLSRLRGVPLTGERLETVLEHVGLKGRADDPLRSFSLGMVQRVKLAALLAASPAILLLDEPGANLDDEGREILRKMVTARRGLTIIASNDREEIAWSDACIPLGRGEADGPKGSASGITAP